MMRTKLPTQELLNELLRYDEATGKLFWRVRLAAKSKGWNKIWANREAFTAINNGGHKQGWFQCKHYLAHRLIYKMVTGLEPSSIDHINGAPTDNRMVNLRGVTHQVNLQNSRRRKDNTSGTTGVYYSQDKWRAYININKKRVMLGDFATKELAITCRKSAEMKHGYHPNHGRVMAA